MMNLKERLLEIGADARDILDVLKFETDKVPKRVNNSTVEFFTGSSTTELYARVSIKNGQLKSIELSPKFNTQENQDLLVELVRSSISLSHGTKVLSRIVFSDLPINGIFTWNNTLQLRPLLKLAEIGSGLNPLIFDGFRSNLARHNGPPFPLLLEVKVPKSPNLFLENNRGFRLLDQYQLLLSIILVGRLRPIHPYPSPNWSLVKHGDKTENHLLPVGFAMTETLDEDDFSTLNIAPITEIPAQDYYARLGLDDRELTVPDNIKQTLDTFDTLDKKNSQRFIRACYWHVIATQTWQMSDLAVIAFATSIEALALLPETKRKACSQCKANLGLGPTQKFRSFVSKYAGLSSNLHDRERELYAIRSKFVHGLRASHIDFGSFSILSTSHEELLLMYLAAKRSLINWLLDPNRE